MTNEEKAETVAAFTASHFFASAIALKIKLQLLPHMIITVSGAPGSGKSTVARLVANKLGFRHYSAGDFMREIAAKRGLSLLELSKVAEKDRSVDEELDQRTAKLGENKEDFVMDSRLAFHFIPGSLKVFLVVDENEAAKRIYSDVQKKKAGRKVEKESTTLAATLTAMRKRKKSEELRYKRYYRLNPYKKEHYDLVIDTTRSAPEKVVDKILDEIKKQQTWC